MEGRRTTRSKKKHKTNTEWNLTDDETYLLTTRLEEERDESKHSNKADLLLCLDIRRVPCLVDTGGEDASEYCLVLAPRSGMIRQQWRFPDLENLHDEEEEEEEEDDVIVNCLLAGLPTHGHDHVPREFQLPNPFHKKHPSSQPPNEANEAKLTSTHKRRRSDQKKTNYVLAASPPVTSSEDAGGGVELDEEKRQDNGIMISSRNTSGGKGFHLQSLREGRLMKMGGLRKNWKERYFSLFVDRMEYRENPRDDKPKGVIPLVRDRTLVVSQALPSFSFTVHTPEEEKKSSVLGAAARKYHLQAGTEEDQENWLDSLQALLSTSVVYSDAILQLREERKMWEDRKEARERKLKSRNIRPMPLGRPHERYFGSIEDVQNFPTVFASHTWRYNFETQQVEVEPKELKLHIGDGPSESIGTGKMVLAVGSICCGEKDCEVAQMTSGSLCILEPVQSNTSSLPLQVNRRRKRIRGENKANKRKLGKKAQLERMKYVSQDAFALSTQFEMFLGDVITPELNKLSRFLELESAFELMSKDRQSLVVQMANSQSLPDDGFSKAIADDQQEDMRHFCTANVEDLGFSFWRPQVCADRTGQEEPDDDYVFLGDVFAEGYGRPLRPAQVLRDREVLTDAPGALVAPIKFVEVWRYKNDVRLWEPVPDSNRYVRMGLIATAYFPPPLKGTRVRCVGRDFLMRSQRPLDYLWSGLSSLLENRATTVLKGAGHDYATAFNNLNPTAVEDVKGAGKFALALPFNVVATSLELTYTTFKAGSALAWGDVGATERTSLWLHPDLSTFFVNPTGHSRPAPFAISATSDGKQVINDSKLDSKHTENSADSPTSHSRTQSLSDSSSLDADLVLTLPVRLAARRANLVAMQGATAALATEALSQLALFLSQPADVERKNFEGVAVTARQSEPLLSYEMAARLMDCIISLADRMQELQAASLKTSLYDDSQDDSARLYRAETDRFRDICLKFKRDWETQMGVLKRVMAYDMRRYSRYLQHFLDSRPRNDEKAREAVVKLLKRVNNISRLLRFVKYASWAEVVSWNFPQEMSNIDRLEYDKMTAAMDDPLCKNQGKKILPHDLAIPLEELLLDWHWGNPANMSDFLSARLSEVLRNSRSKNEQGKYDVEYLIGPMNTLMVDLKWFAPRMAFSATVTDSVLTSYHVSLMKALQAFPLKTLQVTDLLRLVAWARSYRKFVGQAISTTSMATRVKEDVSRMMELVIDLYVDRSKQKAIPWITNILQMEQASSSPVLYAAIVPDDETRYPYTNAPLDLFSNIQRMIGHARENDGLQGMVLARVAIMFTQILHYFVLTQTKFICSAKSVDFLVVSSLTTPSNIKTPSGGKSMFSRFFKGKKDKEKQPAERRNSLPPPEIEEGKKSRRNSLSQVEDVEAREVDLEARKRELTMKIGRVEKPPDYFLAQANNLVRFKTELKTLSTELLMARAAEEKLPGEVMMSDGIVEDMDEIQQSFEDIEDGFISLAKVAVGVLADQVSARVSLLMEGINLERWLTHRAEILQETLGRVDDYFGLMFRGLANPYEMGYLIERTIIGLSRSYVKRFIQQAERMLKDEVRLQTTTAGILADTDELEKWLKSTTGLAREEVMQAELACLPVLSDLLMADENFLPVQIENLKKNFPPHTPTDKAPHRVSAHDVLRTCLKIRKNLNLLTDYKESEKELMAMLPPEQKDSAWSEESSNKEYAFPIQVTVVSAADLVAADANGFSDPYVKITLQDAASLPDAVDGPYKAHFMKLKSQVIEKSLNPTWNFCFKIDAAKMTRLHTIRITVWDHDTFGYNDFLGGCEVTVVEIFQAMAFQAARVGSVADHCTIVRDLKPRPGRQEKVKGSLTLSVEMLDHTPVPVTAPAAPDTPDKKQTYRQNSNSSEPEAPQITPNIKITSPEIVDPPQPVTSAAAAKLQGGKTNSFFKWNFRRGSVSRSNPPSKPVSPSASVQGSRRNSLQPQDNKEPQEAQTESSLVGAENLEGDVMAEQDIAKGLAAAFEEAAEQNRLKKQAVNEQMLEFGTKPPISLRTETPSR
eukprot:g75963.t1